MSGVATVQANRWTGAWPDALGFASGLALAWCFGWNTTDLVWSLWLSSLVVGYALILWLLTAPLRETIAGIATDRSNVGGAGGKALVLVILGAGTLFGVAFFTLHFGGFHLGHSLFLAMFFPITGEPPQQLIDPSLYGEVVRRYWWFLPAAFLAERNAFRSEPRAADTSVTPAAIAARKARGDSMMLPYRNVIRMHLLIFFFAFAHFTRLENFLVYAVVFAVYFFPWRLVRRPETGGTT